MAVITLTGKIESDFQFSGIDEDMHIIREVDEVEGVEV